MKHYYLVASLPALHFGDPPPMSAADFDRLCERHLSPREVVRLRAAWDGHPQREDTAGAPWHHTECRIRNAVARARAERRKTDPAPHLREHPGYDVSIEESVREAFARSTPLDRERALDRLRWGRLDDVARRDRFGIGALMAYGFQIRIAERWAALHPETGSRVLEDVVSAALAPLGATG